MHIPAHMMKGSICPVSACVSAVVLAAAAYYVKKNPSVKNRRETLAAALGAFVFAAQMLNFPIQQGVSGHLVGGVLLASFLGVPLGVLTMSFILIVQSLFFGDGGIDALGLNIFNMAILNVGVGGYLLKVFRADKQNSLLKKYSSLAVISWISIMVAILFCAVELAWGTGIRLLDILPSLMLIHAKIGFVEAILTICVLIILGNDVYSDNQKKYGIEPKALSLALGGIFFLIPFSSSAPDGLDWILQQHRAFFYSGSSAWIAPFPEYQIGFPLPGPFVVIFSGLLGIVAIFLLGSFLAKGLPSSEH